MNSNDLHVALSFLEPDEVETVLLQCFKWELVPYVKRLLKHTLGEPSAMLQMNEWRYGNKTFLIQGVEQNTFGFRGKVFYISCKHGEDWLEIAQRDMANGVAYPAPYLMTSTFGLGDLYTALVGDGMTGYEALSLIANSECIEV